MQADYREWEDDGDHQSARHHHARKRHSRTDGSAVDKVTFGREADISLLVLHPFVPTVRCGQIVAP